jgi:hypothetical protein
MQTINLKITPDDKKMKNHQKTKTTKPEYIKLSSLLILLILACSAFLPLAQAVVPAPDGGYPGGNTAEGQAALLSLTTGGFNTAVGFLSLRSNTEGQFNTATGAGTLLANTADENTATGAGALLSNTTGLFNTAHGAFALFSNTEGAANTANGDQALFSNTTGGHNTANGVSALFSNTTGFNNTAVGNQTLFNNTADANTATGAFALQANTIGGVLATVQGFEVGPNTAVGSHALESNIDSSGNTTVGYQALRSMLTGLTGLPELGISTAVGFQALANVNGPNNYANDAFGYQALLDLTDGNTNVAIGTRAGRGLTTGFGNIYIGAFRPAPVATESQHTYIGNINSTSVSGAGTDSVTVDLTTGLLGHLSSSRRYKENIKPMDNASETLYRLKPVTYSYKKDVDRTQSLDYGLIAEDVANVDPNLAVRDGKGQIESVRYTAVNAMLLNEFLKEHRRVQELETTMARQAEGMEALTAQVKEQAAQIQNVGAQIEVKNPAPQIVVNPLRLGTLTTDPPMPRSRRDR